MVHAYFIFQQQSRAEQTLLIWPGCCTGTWADFMSAHMHNPLLCPLWINAQVRLNTTHILWLSERHLHIINFNVGPRHWILKESLWPPAVWFSNIDACRHVPQCKGQFCSMFSWILASFSSFHSPVSHTFDGSSSLFWNKQMTSSVVRMKERNTESQTSSKNKKNTSAFICCCQISRFLFWNKNNCKQWSVSVIKTDGLHCVAPLKLKQ